ncbi:Uncharacterized protein Adt_11459 [Abeliophyllum distichum]|uniref:Uncharacterized protein n=1 Tax=Abeliophyllum distichum TaxID=126358 RepID=A0ABD1UN45_9LAMI
MGFITISSTRLVWFKGTAISFSFSRRCPITNTFGFPLWEAIVTLQNIVIIGSYAILGDSTLSSLGDRATEKSFSTFGGILLGLVEGKQATKHGWESSGTVTFLAY